MATRARLRGLGITIGQLPTGEWNAITDVPGVKVGHTTLIRGSGPLVPGEGPVRTGVTVVIPHDGPSYERRVPAATHVLNGSGEMTGRAQVDEWGVLVSPIYLTSTHNVGLVYDAAVGHALRESPRIANPGGFVIPLVTETSDAKLNDVAGRHVKQEHVYAAIESASTGIVEEGNCGGGTGMVSYGFKGGIGTSSRRVQIEKPYVVGVLVQANHGRRRDLMVGHIPLGRLSAVPEPDLSTVQEPAHREGSIILVVGTDAPLLPSQLRRLAVRATLGLARTGTISAHGSGDIAIAFSVGNIVRLDDPDPLELWRSVRGDRLEPLFEATVEAAEESVLNALTAAQTMEGRDGRVVDAVSLEELRELAARSSFLAAGGPTRALGAIS